MANPLKKHDKLRTLVNERKITIGIKRDYANTIWGKSFLGWFFNILTIVLVIVTVYLFIKNGILIGLTFFVLTGVYVYVIQKLASMIIRMRMLRHGQDGFVLFQEAYWGRMATIRNNETGEIIHHPKNWMEWLDDNFDTKNKAGHTRINQPD